MTNWPAIPAGELPVLTDGTVGIEMEEGTVMAENDQTTGDTGGAPEKPKRTRKPRATTTGADNSTNALLTKILEQNALVLAENAKLRADMESLKLAQSEAEITPPPDAANLNPGEFYNVGTEERPVVMKRAWTLRDMERLYPMVEFRPEEDMIVAPHGVVFELHRRQQVRVPSIVVEFHDESIARREAESRRYRPLSMNENYALAERAMVEPDVKHWSRLYRLPGSLYMPAAVEASTTADTAEEIAARANKK